MSASDEKRVPSRLRRFLTIGALALSCLFVLLFLALKIYLSTTLPKEQLSRFLSDYLQQKVAVGSVSSTGSTFYLKNVVVANPAGFAGAFLQIRSLAVSPNLTTLFSDRRSLRLVELEGVRLNLEKDRHGVWNFAHLQKVLASKKPTRKETFIGRFGIRNGTVSVNGEEIGGISLKMFDLTAKGSLPAGIDLICEDSDRNRYHITGSVRAGKEPVVNLALSAPKLSLKRIGAAAKLKDRSIFENAGGALTLNCVLQGAVLRAAAELTFHGIRSPFAGRDLAGTVTGSVSYDGRSDRARVEGLALALPQLGVVRASGLLEAVRSERRFSADLAAEPVDLAALPFLLPEKERPRVHLGGRLILDALHLEGRAGKGVTAAEGSARVEDAFLLRDGRLFFEKTEMKVDLSKEGDGFAGKGELREKGGDRRALLQDLRAPFSFRLSRTFQPVRAEVPRLEAVYAGIPITGRVSLREAGAPDRLTAHLVMERGKAELLNRWLGKTGVTFGSGTVSAALNAAGETLKALRFTASAQLNEIKGTMGGKLLAAKSGQVLARLDTKGGETSAAGKARIAGLTVDGKRGATAFSFRYAGELLQLEELKVDYAGAAFAAARVIVQRAPKEVRAGDTRLPLSIDASGCDLRRGDLAARSSSIRMRGGYHNGPGGKWLDGDLELSPVALFWKRKPVAAPAARVAFSKDGAKAALRGALLNGTMAGEAAFDLFAPSKAVAFSLGLKDLSLAQASSFLSKRPAFSPPGGSFDGELKGRYRKPEGFAADFRVVGKGVSITGASRKTLFSGSAVSLTGRLDRKKLLLDDSVLTLRSGATLRAKGEVERPFAPGRKGAFSLSVPQGPVEALVDPLVNVMPRFIQESDISGAVGAEAKLTIGAGKAVLAGSLALKDARLEVPSQKLVVEGVEGRIPLSVDLTGRTAEKQTERLSYSRANFPELLKRLRERVTEPGAPSLAVARIALANLELGALSVHFAATDGTTEITSLTASFYDGTLLGRGSLFVHQGLRFRADVLSDGVSLKRLCAAIPGLKGYISGRVDGIVSLAGVEKGAAGLVGFVDLWARQGKGEKMLVSKEFLQRLSKRKITGFFFASDRPYDKAEIKATLEESFLTFEKLDLVHTNVLGVRDVSVSIAPTQNRIELRHLFEAIKQAAARSKEKAIQKAPEGKPAPAPEFKWEE